MADLACSTCQLQLGTFCIYSGVFNYIADAFVKSLVRKTLPDSPD
jgi:hypothetical protein